MKNVWASVWFGVCFTVVDIIAYIILSISIGIILKNFALVTAINAGLDAVLWRFVFLQAVIQVVAVSAVRRIDLQRNFLVVLIAVMISLLISRGIIAPDFSSVWRHFYISLGSGNVGSGVVVLVSAAFAWLTLFFSHKSMMSIS